MLCSVTTFVTQKDAVGPSILEPDVPEKHTLSDYLWTDGQFWKISFRW